MQTAIEKKMWYDKFIQILDDMPESEGFDSDIADKQIEDLIYVGNILNIKVDKIHSNIKKQKKNIICMILEKYSVDFSIIIIHIHLNIF